MCNSSKSTFIHQLDLVFWDSHHHPNFPPLHQINCQESCIFLFPLQNIQLLHHLEKDWEAQLDPNIHCSTQFHASFLYPKMLASWFCTLLEDARSIPELTQYAKSQPLNNFYICKLNNYNARHTASKIDRNENGR